MYIQSSREGGEFLSSKEVTCIVPAWNCEKYISEALDSIASQTHPCAAVIVVDDGSTDGTSQILSSYNKLKIQYIRQENAGPAAARNNALSHVQTDYVAFLDADDLWLPEKMETQLRHFQTNPDAQLCTSHMQNFWSPELFDNERVEMPGLLEPWSGRNLNSLLARRSVFDRVGLFNPKMLVGEDTDWFVRSVQMNITMEIVPQVLVHHRLHSGNLSRIYNKESREALLRSAKQLIDWKQSL